MPDLGAHDTDGRQPRFLTMSGNYNARGSVVLRIRTLKPRIKANTFDRRIVLAEVLMPDRQVSVNLDEFVDARSDFISAHA